MQILGFILKVVGYIGLFFYVVGVLTALWETFMESIKPSGRQNGLPLPWWVFWRH